jgi:hypothetical protein
MTNTATVMDTDMRDAVAWAINGKWNECREVPFPLYQQEAEALAEAAIAAVEAYRVKAPPEGKP